MDSKKINAKRLLFALIKKKKYICTTLAGFALIVTATLSIISDPVALITKYCIRIDSGSYIYNKLHQKFEGITMKFYIFNITNSDRFLAGLDKNLKLQEVGPFTYKESRQNTNIELDGDHQVLRYTPNCTPVFVPELSMADPKDITIIVPNIVLLALHARLAQEPFWLRAPLLAALRMLPKEYQSNSVLTMTAHDLLHGFKDPFVNIGNTYIPGLIYFEKIGILDIVSMFFSPRKVFDPRRNIRYALDATDEKKFQIISVNGVEGISKLGYDNERTECNSFQDTYEGVLYPSAMNSSSKIKFYHKVFCRILEMEYIGNKTLGDGHRVHELRFNRDTYKQSKKTECYCPTKRCYDGVWDISSCLETDVPIVLSNAHFLYADKRAFNRLEGLHPDEKKHGSQFYIDTTIGLPLKAHFSVQANLIIGKEIYVPAARPFADMMVPFAWSDIDQLPLPDDIAVLLNIIEFYLPITVSIIQVISILSGFCLIIYTCRLVYHSSCRDVKSSQCRTPNIMRSKNSITETSLMITDKRYEIKSSWVAT